MEHSFPAVRFSRQYRAGSAAWLWRISTTISCSISHSDMRCVVRPGATAGRLARCSGMRTGPFRRRGCLVGGLVGQGLAVDGLQPGLQGDLAISAGDWDLLIRIRRGKGDGTFETAKVIADGWSQWLTSGDFNKDGKRDFASITGQWSRALPFPYLVSSRIAVFLGNGDGTFEQPVDYGSRCDYGGLFAMAANLNGDAGEDLLFLNDGVRHVARNGDERLPGAVLLRRGRTTASRGGWRLHRRCGGRSCSRQPRLEFARRNWFGCAAGRPGRRNLHAGPDVPERRPGS